MDQGNRPSDPLGSREPSDCVKTIVPFFYPPLTTKFRLFLKIRDTNYLLFHLYPPLLAVDLVSLLVITQAAVTLIHLKGNR